MRDSAVKRWSTFHTVVFRATGGLVGKRLVDNDMLLLTTTGRATGRKHTVPLLFLSAGDRIVLVASYGGRYRHPEWYLNLDADPIVSVRLPMRRRRRMLARTASPVERDEWWPKIVDAYGGYEEYQRRTDREIPVVFVEPPV